MDPGAQEALPDSEEAFTTTASNEWSEDPVSELPGDDSDGVDSGRKVPGVPGGRLPRTNPLDPRKWLKPESPAPDRSAGEQDHE